MENTNLIEKKQDIIKDKFHYHIIFFSFCDFYFVFIKNTKMQNIYKYKITQKTVKIIKASNFDGTLKLQNF